jgi:hypothetical protein
VTYIPNTTIVAVAASCVSYGGQIVSRIRTRNTSPRALPRGLNLPKNMRPTIPLSRDGALRLAWFARERRETPARALEQLLFRQLPSPPFPVLANRSMLPLETQLFERGRVRGLARLAAVRTPSLAEAVTRFNVPLGLLVECKAKVLADGNDWWLLLHPRPGKTRKSRRKAAEVEP